MIPIEEVYPDIATDVAASGYFHAPSDYNPLLKSLGYTILLQVDDGDYQGDSRLVLQDEERYGFLVFGWGSCSGCDSLLRCDNFSDIDELRTELVNGIQWFDKQGIVHFIHNHDWEGDFWTHRTKATEFIPLALALFE